MVRIAPRYDPRILELASLVDDRREPLAEICRRVGAAAERLGVTRPSYVHLRRLIHAERRRQDELRAAVGDVVEDLFAYRVPDIPELVERIRDARRR